MPKFFFDVHVSRGPVIKDRTGVDLPDFETARTQTQDAISRTISEKVRAGQTIAFCAIEICDEYHCPLLRLPFLEADPRLRAAPSWLA